ncbi:MAG TPA: Uma2 family endonuclease, partial [Candidatus Elarobacter sp.]
AVPRISALRASVITRMKYRLSEALGQRALVAVRPTVIVSDLCEPEPDLGVFAWKNDFYRSATPRSSDVIALIETGDAEPAFCRDRKLPTYSEAHIPECWIVDLVLRHIEVYRRDGCAGFGAPIMRSGGEPITLSAFSEVMFTVDELLG